MRGVQAPTDEALGNERNETMNRTLGTVMASLLLVAAATAASAAARVTVTSDAPARVFLDGRLAGNAPLQLRAIPRGLHVVEVRKIHGNLSQSFQVHSPARRMVVQNINAVWPRVVVQPVAVVPACAPTVVAAPVRQVVVDTRAQQERDKVRARNVLLGAAVANELLNKGNSKGLVRGVTLGGALINEIAR